MAANDPEIGKRIVAAGIEANCLEAGEGKPLRGIFRRCEHLMTRFAPSKIRSSWAAVAFVAPSYLLFQRTLFITSPACLARGC